MITVLCLKNWVVDTPLNTHTPLLQSPLVSALPQSDSQMCRPWRLSGAQRENPAVMRGRESHKPPVSGQVGTTGSFDRRCSESGSVCWPWGNIGCEERGMSWLAFLMCEEYHIVLFWTSWALCTFVGAQTDISLRNIKMSEILHCWATYHTTLFYGQHYICFLHEIRTYSTVSCNRAEHVFLSQSWLLVPFSVIKLRKMLLQHAVVLIIIITFI